MSKTRIELLDPSAYGEWDKLVVEAPTGQLFHSTRWLAAAGCQVRVYVCSERGHVEGGVALNYRRLPGGLRVAYAPALTPRMGPVFSHRIRASRQRRITQALAERLSEDFVSVQLDLTPDQVDVLPYLWSRYQAAVQYTYLLPLGDTSKLWDEMDSVRRRNIRRALKDGVEVESGEDVNLLLNLFAQVHPAAGKSPSFRKMFLRCDDSLAREGRRRVLVASDGAGNPLAAAYIVWDDRCAYYLLGGHVREDSHHGATTLALWEAIQYASTDLGLTTFDFEGSMMPRIESYFRKFGGAITPYFKVSSTPGWLRGLLAVRRAGRRLRGRQR